MKQYTDINGKIVQAIQFTNKHKDRVILMLQEKQNNIYGGVDHDGAPLVQLPTLDSYIDLLTVEIDEWLVYTPDSKDRMFISVHPTSFDIYYTEVSECIVGSKAPIASPSEIYKAIEHLPLTLEPMIPRSDIDKILILTRYDLHSSQRLKDIDELCRANFTGVHHIWDKAPYVIFAEEGNVKRILKARQ